MAQYWALSWDIKPGSQDIVREAFKNYGRPDHTIRDEEGNEIGTLLSTLVFMKGNNVIRVVETTDGVPLPLLGQHMGRQPAIQELEAILDEHVAEPRDMSTAEGARAFFMQSTMELLASRKHDE